MFGFGTLSLLITLILYAGAYIAPVPFASESVVGIRTLAQALTGSFFAFWLVLAILGTYTKRKDKEAETRELRQAEQESETW